MEIPQTWQPVIGVKIESTVVEEIVAALRDDINDTFAKNGLGEDTIFQGLNVASSTISDGQELLPYLLVDSHNRYNTYLRDLQDVSLVYRDEKKFVITFVLSSRLVSTNNQEEARSSDIYLLAIDRMTTIAKIGLKELVNILRQNWQMNAISFPDLQGEENELVLSHIEYDIGQQFSEILVFGEENDTRIALLLRYVFQWTKPGKYRPPNKGDIISGRGYEKTRLRFEQIAKK